MTPVEALVVASLVVLPVGLVLAMACLGHHRPVVNHPDRWFDEPDTNQRTHDRPTAAAAATPYQFRVPPYAQDPGEQLEHTEPLRMWETPQPPATYASNGRDEAPTRQ